MNLIFRPIEQWPGPLTANRRLTPFDAPWKATLTLLDRECGHLQGVNTRTHHALPVVVQLAVPEGAIRQDGHLIANRRPPEHPGVILNIETPTGPLRFSCDRFDGRWNNRTTDTWRHNLRAIALGLEALRKIDRYGLGSGHEQYRGFQALPPATPMGGPLTVDQAITILHDANPGRWDWDDPDAVQQAWRAAAKTHHPDAGGDPAVFRRLTDARDVLIGAQS